MSDEPKKMTDRDARERARLIRDRQWRIMEKADKYGAVWCRTASRWLEPKEDEEHYGYIAAEELFAWFRELHPDWLIVGARDETRKAYPITLTDAGRAALANRDTYNMEPVYGGMVEPGWQAIPLESEDA